MNLGYRLDNFLSKKFPQLAGDLYMNRNQIMRDPKLVMNPRWDTELINDLPKALKTTLPILILQRAGSS